MNDIKKTPLEHALDLIQAQKAWIMAVPDDTPLPAMPGFDREEADQLEAVLAEQVAFEKSLNTLPEHDALIKAITMCPHTIDAERVTLEWSGASPGGNTALNQLTTRIHEWKKQFSGPSFIDLRDMPDDQKHAIMQSIKALAQPVAKVDANDEGYWADILPDRTVKVGQLLYDAAQPAKPLTEPQRKAIYDAVQGLDVMKAILLTEAAYSGTKGQS